jgi:N-acetylglucosaminyldiphosphoundecaprenol N-acetyl-beta-D-mannosaminyltransferase
MKEKYILGVKVNTEISPREAVEKAAEMLEEDKFHIITTTNAEFIIDAQSDPEFKSLINGADLSVPDGAGVLYADCYLDKVRNIKKGFIKPLSALKAGLSLGLRPLSLSYVGQRVSGVELMLDLCEYASKNGKSVFFLGGRLRDSKGKFVESAEELSEITAGKLKERFPGLQVVGHTSKFSAKPSDDESTLAYIHKCMSDKQLSHIDMIFVAYNHPGQEKWLLRNGDKIPVRLGIGVGGSFDYVSMTVKRAPKVFVNMNIEWLYKLITQPWRFKRIIKAFPIFPYKVYLSSL